MADEQSDDQERSHEATPQKIQKAREKGDVPVSTEAHTAAAYLGLLIGLSVVGAGTVELAGARLKSFMSRPESFLDSSLSGAAIFRAATDIGAAILPLLLFPMAAVLASLFAQNAFAFAPSKLEPKFSRISIPSNAKQKFGPKGIAEFTRSLLKLTFVIAVAGFAALGAFTTLPGFVHLDAGPLSGALYKQELSLLALFFVASATIAAIDLPWRRFEHAKRNRMSFEDIKKENKDSEGDPYIKSARRDRARAAAQRNQMLEVPKADVILVNPTHYAVALKWDRQKGGAPTCVAKGVDEVARRIREVAAEAGVPIRRDPPTTRSIYELVEVGDEIRREHYAAVAAAIHFAERMRTRARGYDWSQR
ncbi:MAG: flagellar type III secretion system protein FlhB [Alphaproteobacteria bacterium]|nr:flagellar type III secretion system protein FlhB [Alphaproteobacteria bacterium]